MTNEKKIKYITTHMIIVLIMIGGIFNVYSQSFGFSCCRNQLSAFADDDTSSWESVNSSDLVTAFRYYCKSRNLAIDGSVADAVTSFTTSSFNNICNTLGIDPTQLQAELKKTTAGNLGLRFLFTQTGVNAYNRIFAEFLQNNDLSVGDEVNDKEVYNVKTFTDDDGNSCIVYIINVNGNDTYTRYGVSSIVTHGTYLKYNPASLSGGDVVTFNINGNTYTKTVELISNSTNGVAYGNNINIKDMYYSFYGDSIGEGCITVIYNSATGSYFLGSIGIRNSNVANYYLNTYSTASIANISSQNVNDSPVYVNSPTINNNTYNSNYTIIYNEGDYYEDDEEPSPDTPPAGGGGGGGDNPSDPDDWEPTSPTIPDPSSPDFPSVEIPDIDIPDLPSLNFSLGDLSEKFPFSIPFDAIALLTVLDGEPQAPHIQATIPIGTYYIWDFDVDFAEFDNYARIFRAFEFIGFCIGLIWLTIHFVKG